MRGSACRLSSLLPQVHDGTATPCDVLNTAVSCDEEAERTGSQVAVTTVVPRAGVRLVSEVSRSFPECTQIEWENLGPSSCISARQGLGHL